MNIGSAQFTTTQLAQNIGGASSASVAQRPVANIADLLQRASGGAAAGTLAAALEAQNSPAGQNTAVPASNSVLAATINPSINLSPSTSLQVTDFVNASANAFPTEAPPAPTPQAAPQTNDNTNANATDNTGNTGGYQPPAPADTNTTGNTDSGSNAAPAVSSQGAGASVLTGIYSDIASASVSIIRGSSVNTVA